MPKGGMGANPVGTGNERIDRIDFSAFCSGSDSPLKMLFLNVIADAANNYLYYGLAKNGTTPEEFWYATEYFMTVRSYKPATWRHARFMKKTIIDPETGKRQSIKYQLSDNELKLACFDRHLEIAELDKHGFTDEKFSSWIKVRRDQIVEENLAQVEAYIDLVQRTSLHKISGGRQLSFQVNDVNLKKALVHPSSPEEVANLIYYKGVSITRKPVTRRAQAKRIVSSRVRRGKLPPPNQQMLSEMVM